MATATIPYLVTLTLYPNPNPNPNQGAWPSRTLIGKQQGALASRA